MGIYDDDWSGDTETMRIRGSGRAAGSSDLLFLEEDAELVTRLISTDIGHDSTRSLGAFLRHRDLVKAPTNPMGAMI